MTALASTDVTVAVSVRDRDIVRAGGSKNISIATVSFGNGSLTYPSGGVPLPGIGTFGFQRTIDFAAIEQPVANGFVYKFDRENHKIKIFTQGAKTGSTGTTTCANGALAEDSAAAETVVRLSGTAVDTTYDLGGMIELPTAIAPAAAAMQILLLGD